MTNLETLSQQAWRQSQCILYCVRRSAQPSSTQLTTQTFPLKSAERTASLSREATASRTEMVCAACCSPLVTSVCSTETVTPTTPPAGTRHSAPCHEKKASPFCFCAPLVNIPRLRIFIFICSCIIKYSGIICIDRVVYVISFLYKSQTLGRKNPAV